jgi:hypothetical protein
VVVVVVMVLCMVLGFGRGEGSRQSGQHLRDPGKLVEVVCHLRRDIAQLHRQGALQSVGRREVRTDKRRPPVLHEHHPHVQHGH